MAMHEIPDALSSLRGMGLKGTCLEQVVEGQVKEAEGGKLGEACGDLREAVFGQIQRSEPLQAAQRWQRDALRPRRLRQRHALQAAGRSSAGAAAWGTGSPPFCFTPTAGLSLHAAMHDDASPSAMPSCATRPATTSA